MQQAATTNPVPSHGKLRCRGIEVDYGGVVALAGVDLDINPGECVGLIGPNGSGKSTFINVISGAQPALRGEVELDGVRLDGLSPDRRAHLGIARTFQALRVFDTLSILDNLILGAHRRQRTTLVGSVLHTRAARRERRQLEEEAADLLAVFGERLRPRLRDQVAALSYANRRRVELARAIMMHPVLLLLDEPSAGMNPAETDELAVLIPELAARSGASVRVVEHKMDFIGSLCRKVHVLDHGTCLAVGSPEAVQAEPKVAEAFLGVE